MTDRNSRVGDSFGPSGSIQDLPGQVVFHIYSRVFDILLSYRLLDDSNP